LWSACAKLRNLYSATIREDTSPAANTAVARLDRAIQYRRKLANEGTLLLRLHTRQPNRRYALHGVTNDLIRRVAEHKSKAAEGFTKRYDVERLVYFEIFEDIENAIRREKRLKKWTRAWKISLIEKENPDWNDLYPGIAGG
jgi:putative endonuclease